MMKSYLAVSLLVLALTGGSARADVPAWCATLEATSTGFTDYDLKGEGLLNEQYPISQVNTILTATCRPNADALKRMAKIDAGREHWAKRLDMTEADWVDAVAWANQAQHARGGGGDFDMYPADRKAAWSTLGPVDQYAVISTSGMGDSSRVADSHYIADSFGTRLTEVGRLGYLSECLGSNSTNVEWAMCQPDFVAFDRGKFATELRADKDTGERKMKLRFILMELTPKMKQREGDVKALIASDAEYGKLFDLANAARAEWVTRWQAEAALVDLATAMDDARVTKSRKALADCDARTWAAFSKAVSAVPAKQFSAFKLEPGGDSFTQQATAMIASQPAGYLASLAYFLCKSNEEGVEKDYLTREIGGAMQWTAGYRGPRNSTHMAILSTKIVLDDRDAKLGYPGLERPWLGGGGSSSGGTKGKVGTVKVKDGKATITFPKQMEKAKNCTKWKQTNRIVQIRNDGGIVYDSHCLAYETVVFDGAPDPYTVNARHAEGLKKGMFIRAVEDVLEVAWPKADATEPVRVFGIAVKK